MGDGFGLLDLRHNFSCGFFFYLFLLPILQRIVKKAQMRYRLFPENIKIKILTYSVKSGLFLYTP